MAVVGVTFVGMLLWFIIALLFRWRFQFSIRSLLVMVVVVAVPCGWMAVEVTAAKRHQEAAKLFLLSDCDVFYDDCTDEDGNPADINHSWAKFVSPQNEGPLLWLLGRDFFHSTRTVAAVIPLIRYGIHPRLNNGTAEFMKHDVAEAMLLALDNLPDLRALDLSGVPINDSDLEHVMPLKKLRKLVLTGTKVTDEGVKKLQQALPNCTIIR